jgi:septation ring formation regulator EzrA
MDPISFAASIITVIATVATVAKSLDELRDALQHAPDVLSSLVNEVSDLRIVLEACDSAVQELYKDSHQQSPPTPLADATQVLSRTQIQLKELDSLIKSCLHGQSTGPAILTSARLRWIKARNKAERIQQQLRDSKQHLFMLMESQSV